MGFGIVLGGGGTRGSYHIGAYKALSELSKFPDFIVGTSIGAINGAVIAQGDFDKLEKIWNNVNIEDCVEIPANLQNSENLFDVKNISEIIKIIYQKKGIDSSPLRRLIDSVTDEEKLKNSNVDFGLVTFSLTDKKEIALLKKDIPKGHLTDYLLASARFPGLKPVKIKQSVFIDGGVTNNIPISLLADKDINDIAVIDVGGVGIVKSSDISGKNIITVRSENPAVGIMDFSDTEIKQNIRFGYFDTLRAFGKCVGKRYYIDTQSYYKSREVYSEELLWGLEKAAEALKIDIFKIYTVEELIAKVCSEYAVNPKNTSTGDILKGLNEKNIVCTLAKAIINKNSEFLANKMITGILGGMYDAASAIAYFCGK